MHKSKIRKSISRKISTAQYESVDVFIEIEDEIEWETPQERLDKSENYTKLMVVDFIKTLDKVATALNVDKKVAVVKAKKNFLDNEE